MPFNISCEVILKFNPNFIGMAKMDAIFKMAAIYSNTIGRRCRPMFWKQIGHVVYQILDLRGQGSDLWWN